MSSDSSTSKSWPTTALLSCQRSSLTPAERSGRWRSGRAIPSGGASTGAASSARTASKSSSRRWICRLRPRWGHYAGTTTLPRSARTETSGKTHGSSVRSEKPPFYGVELRPAAIGATSYGVQIDAFGQVLDESQAPIEGLFAAGECTGGTLGSRYLSSGNSLGNCFVFGRVAGRSAAKSTRSAGRRKPRDRVTERAATVRRCVPLDADDLPCNATRLVTDQEKRSRQ